jgi:hypothetical protein
MSPELPELPAQPYVPESGELRPGDVCAAVALLDLDEGELCTSPDAPERLLAPVRINYVVVLAVYEGYATLAPVAVADAVDDGGSLAAIAESSSHERRWLALPPLPGEWDEVAVAFFFLVQTVAAEPLLERRVASMREHEATVLQARFAIAFAGDES